MGVMAMEVVMVTMATAVVMVTDMVADLDNMITLAGMEAEPCVVEAEVVVVVVVADPMVMAVATVGGEAMEAIRLSRRWAAGVALSAHELFCVPSRAIPAFCISLTGILGRRVQRVLFLFVGIFKLV